VGAIGALATAIGAYLLWRKFTPKHTGKVA